MPNGIDRTKLVACLRAQQLAHGNPAQRNLTALLDPSTTCVVTGQQPAVGGGPCYTLVKISHAIAHAQNAHAQNNKLVPLFWCASEDHDVGEANHSDLIDRHARIQRFHHPFAATHASLRFRPALDWWPALWQHAEQHLGQGLGQTFLAQHKPTDNQGLGAWQCQILNALFADYGLLCVEGHHLRPLWHNALNNIITNWPSAALAEQRQQLLQHGINDAFGSLAEPPLFLDRASGRTPLTRAEFSQVNSADYHEVSPGAALRPVLQQIALPAVAYIGGPGELAYHQFIPPIYHAAGVTAPTLIARCSLTIAPSWITRGVSAWDKTLDDLVSDVAKNAAPSAPHTTTSAIAAYDETLQQLIGAQQTAKPPLARRYASAATRLQREKLRLQHSLQRYELHERGLTAWPLMRDYVLPRQLKQERVMSLFQVLWQYGPGIVHQYVAAAARTAAGQHAFISGV
jgi:bacillithiol synthase